MVVGSRQSFFFFADKILGFLDTIELYINAGIGFCMYLMSIKKL